MDILQPCKYAAVMQASKVDRDDDGHQESSGKIITVSS